jgi:hypothetical protein
MALSAEQFNKKAKLFEWFGMLKFLHHKLVTKKEHRDLEKKVDLLDTKLDQFFDVLDTVVKKFDNMEHSFISNQVAHDRF